MSKDMNKKPRKNRLKDRVTILMKNTEDISSLKLLILIVVFTVGFMLIGNEVVFTKSNNIDYVSSDLGDTKITFTGDVSPSRYLKDVSRKRGYDSFYRNIKDIWEDSDITLVNLEASLLPSGVDKDIYNKIPKKSNIYLDVNERDLTAMKEAGINLIGFANNHSMDYGVQGMEDSLEILSELGLRHIGAGKNIYEAVKPYSKKINGRQIGIMAMTDVGQRGSMARSNIPGVNSTRYLHRDFELQKMINKNDFNIVYIHWGTEYALKPDEEIRELGRYFIDMGVDVVIGSHQHVLLPVEKYKDGVIVYGMGNLVFDQKIGRTTDSAVGSLYLDGEDNKFLEFTPINIHNGIPYKTEKPTNMDKIFTALTKELDEDSYEIKDNKLIIYF